MHSFCSQRFRPDNHTEATKCEPEPGGAHSTLTDCRSPQMRRSTPQPSRTPCTTAMRVVAMAVRDSRRPSQRFSRLCEDNKGGRRMRTPRYN